MLEDAGTVTEGERPQVESVAFAEVVERLRSFPTWAASNLETWRGVESAELVRLNAGGVLTRPGDSPLRYSVVLEGKLRADRPEQDGTMTTVGYSAAGGGFGEAPLLHGKTASSFLVHAIEPSVVVRFSEEQFWNLMSCCPSVRQMIIRDFSERMQAYQV